MRCGAVRCGVVWCGVVWCGVVWWFVVSFAPRCGVFCSVLLCCVVPKALLLEGNGRDVYPQVQVNGRAVYRSARCVLMCCCAAGSCARSHLAGTVLPTPVHGHTGSSGPSAPCVLCCTIVLCVRCCTAWCCAPHCTLGALPHCTCGQWAVHLLLCTALGAVGNTTPAMQCLTACGRWAVELLLCTTTLSGGSGLWKSGNALPHCLGEWAVELLQCVGPSAGGAESPTQEAVAAEKADLLQCTATLPGRQWAVELMSCTSGQWNSCHALPHCLGAVGSGTPTMHC